MLKERVVTPGQEYIVLEIDDVDIATRMAHCFDKMKAPLIASFRESPGGLLRVPAKGERWTAKRQGWVWHLEAKMDTLIDHEFVVDSMNPGDTRVQADGTFHIQMERTEMNGRGIAPTVKDTFYSASGFTSFVLASQPVGPLCIHPVLNGMTLAPELWFVDYDNDPSGRTSRFYSTMGAGDLIVTYQAWVYANDDAAVVTGRGVIGQGYDDNAAVVIGIGIPGNANTDAGTVTGRGFMQEEVTGWVLV